VPTNKQNQKLSVYILYEINIFIDLSNLLTDIKRQLVEPNFKENSI